MVPIAGSGKLDNDGNSAAEAASSSEDEAEELYGDSIDEDSQRVRRSTDPANSPTTSGKLLHHKRLNF